ncbi:MAG: alpha/beta hydrolase [Kineosporiaceae bacterium]|jgi:pimeloyl-ACP methyl ester carboxylesterase
MSSEPKAAPPLGTFVEVGGHQLFLDQRGTGSPTVVFLPGAGLTGLDYLPIHHAVAEATASIVYDRGGTGWSEQMALPRTARAVTDELLGLLRSVGADRVLLVGHSLGGLYARHFATRFPDAVQGLVLLDPAHEDYDAYMPPELTVQRGASRYFDVLGAVVDAALTTGPTRALLQMVPAIRRYRRIYRELFTQEMADWPAELRDVLVERHTSLDWLAGGLRESRQIDRLYDEVRVAGPMPDLPLVILTSTGTDGFQDAVSGGGSEQLMQEEISGRLRLYADLAATVSGGEVRRVGSGHVTLPFHHPEAVVAAIRACCA